VHPPDIDTSFAQDGVVVLRSAFSRDDAHLLKSAVWRHIESKTRVRLDDPSTWACDSNFGLGAVERRSIWAPVNASASVTRALDTIFGATEWAPPITVPQVLLTFPMLGAWRLPSGWHIDFGEELPTWPVHAVKMFAFLDTVEPAGGGTVVLRGGHRLVERFTAMNDARPVPDRDEQLLESDRYLRALARGGGDRRLLDEAVEVHGVTIQPLELTGEPGDVVLTHMHVLHAPAPNTGRMPRLMVGNAFRRAS
jgi:hypothetical protein